MVFSVLWYLIRDDYVMGLLCAQALVAGGLYLAHTSAQYRSFVFENSLVQKITALNITFTCN